MTTQESNSKIALILKLVVKNFLMFLALLISIILALTELKPYTVVFYRHLEHHQSFLPII